jgi:uncharacterized membrane protein YtjA (UPF0391 family)
MRPGIGIKQHSECISPLPDQFVEVDLQTHFTDPLGMICAGEPPAAAVFAGENGSIRGDRAARGAEHPSKLCTNEESWMLYYAIVFFVIALIAAVFGFGGIAAGAAGIAKILFFIFLVLFIASLFFGRRR